MNSTPTFAVILDDRASRAKETLQAAGLTSAAYWVGTALLTVCSNAASGGFLVFATVFLGFFDLISEAVDAAKEESAEAHREG